jgi:hypothetical protein
VRLNPLYTAVFRYPESWGARIEGEFGSEAHYVFLAEGRTEGRIAGRLHGCNHPRSRIDGSALPDMQGAIETDDGATVLFDLRGYARPYPKERRQIVLSGHHLSDDERYRWLNDVVCVGVGEIRPRSGGGPRQVHGHDVEFVVDVAELVWEAPAGG